MAAVTISVCRGEHHVRPDSELRPPLNSTKEIHVTAAWLSVRDIHNNFARAR